MENNLTIQINQRGKDNQVIDINGNGCVYITMGKYTYYFDNSTNECLFDRWETDKGHHMGKLEFFNKWLCIDSSDELTNTL